MEPMTPVALRGTSALATIQAIIGEDGKPRHLCIAGGDPEWGKAVAAVFQQWVFEPPTLNGNPSPFNSH
ncbi:MAG TPA: hypothetical protein VKB93_13755 [Thermoanaerobaculia bacterium]|nr:hypothetical protein [Thermoanaerobaculia bacterium]